MWLKFLNHKASLERREETVTQHTMILFPILLNLHVYLKHSLISRQQTSETKSLSLKRLQSSSWYKRHNNSLSFTQKYLIFYHEKRGQDGCNNNNSQCLMRTYHICELLVY